MTARGEGVQLVCLSVSLYQPGGAEEAGEMVNNMSEAYSHRLLHIRIPTSSDANTDIALLRLVFDTLKQFPGNDKVQFAIVSDNGITKLEVPDLATSYCPELHRQLVALVGDQYLLVENIAS